MSTQHIHLITILALLLTAPAIADQPASTPAESPDAAIEPAPPDLLKDRFDPYDAIGQRNAFLELAGPDLEVSRAEFDADRAASNPKFFHRFDSWQEALACDRNRNQSLDWFEADDYRTALRRQLMKTYDRDRNGALTGDERTAANRALASGQLPWRQPANPNNNANPNDPRSPRQRMLDRYDTDGDGQLSEEEWDAAQKAMRDEQRQRMLDEWDADGDGELNEEERQKMWEQRKREGRTWMQRGEAFMLKHFDSDGDGEISSGERAQLRQFREKVREVFQQTMERRLLDKDNDGQISRDERRAAEIRYAPVFMGLMNRFQKWMDLDGDGTVSGDERAQYMANAANNAFDYFETFVADFDANGNGKLDTDEHGPLYSGLARDLTQRMSQADSDQDGDLATLEMQSLVDTFLTDLGVMPDTTEEESPDTSQRP